MLLSLQIITVFFVLVNFILILLLFMNGKEGKVSDLKTRLQSIENNQYNIEKTVRDELAGSRVEMGNSAKQNRDELSSSFKFFSESIFKTITDISQLQKSQLDIFSNQLYVLTGTNEQKMDKMRDTIEKKLSAFQDDNSRKLEKIRLTVDEKLHETLEKRLGESFKLVSDRLEQVHKGLGEMQSLAAGVGDLKKVLTNVKARGILGEIQLGNILEQVLTPEQYATNISTKANSGDRVEYAVKMPGTNDLTVWLPLDSKFPLEDYHRLLEAYEKADPLLIDERTKQLEATVKQCAKTIRDKYIDPPGTTDFGIMFLPIEGLYAEVLRRTGLFETLMREYRIAVTGPTTLAAFLNSLQMGFRTLAIEKRSSEVWSLLGVVKTEFGKFGDILERTHKKLKEASNTIETATKKTRSIERKLRDVQELPSGESFDLLSGDNAHEEEKLNDTQEA
ncbi:MAG: DNA recombination protein RmuC [Bacillota bacterium]|nr:DNA recombination protein RmuC [Bacillota bacterium]